MNEPGTATLAARLDRIPVWPYQRRVLWIVGAGFFFAFFDAVSIGFALPLIESEFDLSKATASLAVAVGLLAYVVGGLLDSRLADMRGRRVALQFSVALLTVGSIMAALSPSLGVLLGGRFLAASTLRAIPNSHARAGSGPGSWRCTDRSAVANVSAVRSKATSANGVRRRRQACTERTWRRQRTPNADASALESTSRS